MNVLSLFAGIGGLDLGLERAGMTVVGQVELDPYCRRVLAKHWPEVPRHDDVRTCVDWWLGTNRPAVDLVCGGFPCQPFSTAGRRQGVADDRWGWPWFWDVVRVLRPRYLLVENVAALLADRHAFGLVLADLAAGGYDAEWDCVPAAAIGAPHIRDRLFLVAYTAGNRCGQGRTGRPARDGADRVGLAAEELADADSQAGRPEAGDANAGVGSAALRERPAQPRGRGGHMADADRPGLPVPEPPAVFGTWRGDEGRAATERGWWAAEPDVGRVAHGVPARVDRLRALGNAVVPQVAEHIGRLITSAHLAVKAQLKERTEGDAS